MEGVIVEDREGKIVSVSDTIFSLLGLDGKDDFQLVSGSELFRFFCRGKNVAGGLMKTWR
jgi:PAS domain-containing protein